jgi:ribosomal subunit interface protein
MTIRDSVQITLRGIPHTDALEARIRSKVGKLVRLFPLVKGCRVVAEVPHQRHSQGNQFVVRLDIAIPGSEIVVNRDHHEDVYVALREAFRAARRQLTGHNGRQSVAMEQPGAGS